MGKVPPLELGTRNLELGTFIIPPAVCPSATRLRTSRANPAGGRGSTVDAAGFAAPAFGVAAAGTPAVPARVLGKPSRTSTAIRAAAANRLPGARANAPNPPAAPRRRARVKNPPS